MSEPGFNYFVTKRGGDARRGKTKKINYALAKFWMVRDVHEGTLEAIDKEGSRILLFIKVGRRRGYNRHVMTATGGKPRVHDDVDEMWRRLPSKFNDLT